jgi:hypothetical protein
MNDADWLFFWAQFESRTKGTYYQIDDIENIRVHARRSRASQDLYSPHVQIERVKRSHV